MRQRLRPVLIAIAGLVVAATSAAAQTRAKPRIVAGQDPGGVAVALVDTGVNYTLPRIAARLARDGEGDIVGIDLPDGDNKPFDDTPAGAEVVVRPHGTALASLIVLAGRSLRLVPVRTAMHDPRSVAAGIAMALRTPARIVAVRLPEQADLDWQPVRAVIAANPRVLFVVSAGGGGQDLDVTRRGAFGLSAPHVLVVAACNDQGGIAPQSNYGARSVDIAVSLDAIGGTDVAGRPFAARDPEFAAAIVAGVAASHAASSAGLDGPQLKRALLTAARPLPPPMHGRAAFGWLPP